MNRERSDYRKAEWYLLSFAGEFGRELPHDRLKEFLEDFKSTFRRYNFNLSIDDLLWSLQENELINFDENKKCFVIAGLGPELVKEIISEYFDHLSKVEPIRVTNWNYLNNQLITLKNQILLKDQIAMRKVLYYLENYDKICPTVNKEFFEGLDESTISAVHSYGIILEYDLVPIERVDLVHMLKTGDAVLDRKKIK